MTFNEFYGANFSEVVRHVAYKLRDEEEAKDLAQNIFIRLYAHWDRIDTTKASYRTYLFRMVRNSLVDYYRAKKSEDLVAISDSSYDSEGEYHSGVMVKTDETANPLENLIGSDYAENFKRVLRTLPILQKRCAVLYIHGFKMKEIAAKLGTTTGTICPMVRHLKVKFQTAL
jgi:RNA polymerase sigma factor (sigma-70 family)